MKKPKVSFRGKALLLQSIFKNKIIVHLLKTSFTFKYFRQITEQPRPSQDLKIKGKAFSQRGQNHGSESIKEYVPKTNPYSLSSDPNHPECNQNKHKSILKRPDSPTKCRKISFNEVITITYFKNYQ